MTNRTLVIVNTTGRQGASVARVASAVGYNVRAHITNKLSEKDGMVAKELRGLENIELVEGSLEDNKLIARLFVGAQRAFINTISWGDEVVIGKALADAAKRAGVQHYVYSSMPDHAVFGHGWPSLPLWSCKFTVENYIRQIGLPATFVYTGIYNNNFTSLPYPLFCMELRPNGSFEWTAPFHPDKPLPWLDAEHDVGPAVLQILKDGIREWSGHRIGLAYQLLTPRQRGSIKVEVPIPSGYRSQLEGIEILLGKLEAPYFGPDIEAPGDALELWEGFRGMEEYAREVFPLEEAANGLTWMH
ncbi:MAG: hypothetical protein Q9202_000282 [Teloschistes flavicans]